jgi:hypothetical protein
MAGPFAEMAGYVALHNVGNMAYQPDEVKALTKKYCNAIPA